MYTLLIADDESGIRSIVRKYAELRTFRVLDSGEEIEEWLLPPEEEEEQEEWPD